MAELLDISKSYLSKIETGYQPPSQAVCDRLEMLTGIQVDAEVQAQTAGQTEERYSYILAHNPLATQEEVIICWKADLIRKKEQLKRKSRKLHAKMNYSLTQIAHVQRIEQRLEEAFDALRNLMDAPERDETAIQKAEQKLVKLRVERYKAQNPNAFTPREVQEKQLELALLNAEIKVYEDQLAQAETHYQAQFAQEEEKLAAPTLPADEQTVSNDLDTPPLVSKNLETASRVHPSQVTYAYRPQQTNLSAQAHLSKQHRKTG